MYKLSRRQVTVSAGAALLLAPFVSMLNARSSGAAAGKQAKRIVLFCTMGTKPDLWTPKVSGESISGFSQMTAPLADIKDNIVLVEGMPAEMPSNNHGSPDGITGMGNSYYAVNNVQQLKNSVDQFVADKLAKGGVNRPIGSLLLGADASTSGITMFYKADKMLTPIASPSSAFNTAFGNISSGGSSGGTTGPTPAAKRRQSILNVVKDEINTVRNKVGAADKSKLDSHLDSIHALENKLSQQTTTDNSMAAKSCAGLTKPTDVTGMAPACANNQLHMDIIVNALACDITRVAGLQWGTDQTFNVDVPGLKGEQHNGFIHSGAPDFKNLIAFEVYLAQQFTKLVQAIKAKPDPDGGGGSMLDSTLVVWARDMGDAVDHNMKSMRFVFASGSNGCLKLGSGGRYVSSGERHERALLAMIQAMGITDFSGFGDPKLTNKTPLAGILAG